MSDGEIVAALDRPDDYEPWALELFRAELGRRALPADVREELRADNTRQAVAEEAQRKEADHRIFVKLIGVSFFFLLIVVRVFWRGR